MPYQRILTIQDISCVGQCSTTVALPILSVCGHETCILPAAVLSTHTGGFGRPVICNLQEDMDAIWRHWQCEGIRFDAIYTGYLGSTEAVHTAAEIMDAMLAPDGKIIVDPAMADHGKRYSGLTEDYADAMQNLCMRADVMIPNITEAAMMSGLPFRETYDEIYIQELLHALGGKDVVLTGVSFETGKTGAAIRRGGKIDYYFHQRFDRSFHGTGDMFAAAFTGAWLQNKSLEEAVQISADFTCQAIYNTIESPAHWYGVKFETALPVLFDALK